MADEKHPERFDALFRQEDFSERSQRPGRIDLTALLKDVAVALVIVARRPGLRVHVRDVEGHFVELERREAGGVGYTRLFAAQLAGLRVGVALALFALTRLEAVGQTNGASAFALVADVLVVANRLVWLEIRGGTGRAEAVAEAFVTTAVIVPALNAAREFARLRATRPLSGTALHAGSQRAWDAAGFVRQTRLRPATRLGAVLFPTAVALFALLDDTVAAKRHFGLREAAFGPASFRRQHFAHRLQTARAELPIVLFVAGSGSGEHDVVSVVAARNANLVILGIVLEKEEANKQRS